MPEKYADPEWREQTTEVIYHSLFANRTEGQHNLLTHFFEGAHFNFPEVSLDAFTAVASEIDLEGNPLLPTDTKKLLSGIGSALAFGWRVLGRPPSSYEFKVKIGKHDKSKSTTDIKEQIENALKKCSQRSQSLDGLAKYVQLSFTAVRYPSSNKRKRLLEEATEVANNLIFDDHPNFSSRLFSSIGQGFDSIDAVDEALASFKTAADIDPEDYAALTNQGNILSRLGRYEEALSTYDTAIEVDPDFFAAWNNKGSTLLEMKCYEEALTFLSRAIKLDPEKELCWANKGRALEEVEHYEEALLTYRKASELHPQRIERYGIQVITMLRLLGRHKEAIDYCDQVLSLHSGDSIIWDSRGLCLSLLCSYDEAISSLDKAITLDELEEGCSLANKSIVLARSGDCKSALAICEQYLQKREDEYGHYAQACCYAIQGDHELALQSLGRAVEMRPNLCKREARQNPDFASLQQTEEFQKLVAL